MPEETMLPRMAAMANADVGRVMVLVILSEVNLSLGVVSFSFGTVVAQGACNDCRFGPSLSPSRSVRLLPHLRGIIPLIFLRS